MLEGKLKIAVMAEKKLRKGDEIFFVYILKWLTVPVPMYNGN